MFSDFDDKQLVIIFSLVSFFSVVVGLGVIFFCFLWLFWRMIVVMFL